MDDQISFLANDFNEAVQAAQFEVLAQKFFDEKTSVRRFFNDFQVKKNRFWKTGNNFRFFIGKKLETIVDCVFLGKSFKRHQFDQFREEFKKIVWVTYRDGFRSLDSRQLINSDMGWGCTIRVGQMMILECLSRHLGISDLELVMMIQENLENAPFALSQVMEVGKTFGKSPGDWFSPANIAYVLTVLLENNPVKNLKPLLSLNSALYEDEVLSVACEVDRKTCRNMCKCEKNEYEDLGVTCAVCGKELVEFHWKYSLFVQVPVMLGLGSVLPEYLVTVKHFLASPYSLGVVGGKPRMALYLLGYTQNSFLVLDPHYVQKSCKSEEDVKKMLSTYHADTLKLLNYQDLEGSMSFGFLLSSFEDWNAFKLFLNQPEANGLVVVRETEDVRCSDVSSFGKSSFLLV